MILQSRENRRISLLNYFALKAAGSSAVNQPGFQLLNEQGRSYDLRVCCVKVDQGQPLKLAEELLQANLAMSSKFES